MVAQLSENTKNHWIVYFKLVTFMVCELYPNEAVFLSRNVLRLKRMHYVTLNIDSVDRLKLLSKFVQQVDVSFFKIYGVFQTRELQTDHWSYNSGDWIAIGEKDRGKKNLC